MFQVLLCELSPRVANCNLERAGDCWKLMKGWLTPPELGNWDSDPAFFLQTTSSTSSSTFLSTTLPTTTSPTYSSPPSRPPPRPTSCQQPCQPPLLRDDSTNHPAFDPPPMPIPLFWQKIHIHIYFVFKYNLNIERICIECFWIWNSFLWKSEEPFKTFVLFRANGNTPKVPILISPSTRIWYQAPNYIDHFLN